MNQTKKLQADTLTDELNRRVYQNLERMLQGVNRAELCRKAGVPESTLSTQHRKGRYTFELLAPLAPALGTTVAELVRAPEPDQIPAEVKAEAFDRVLETVEWARAQGE